MPNIFNIFDVNFGADGAGASVRCEAEIGVETQELQISIEQYPLVIRTTIFYNALEENETIQILHRIGLQNPILLAVWVAPIAKKYGVCVGGHCLIAITLTCYNIYRDHGDELRDLVGRAKYDRFVHYLIERKSELGGGVLRALGVCAIETSLSPLDKIWNAVKSAL